LPQSRIGVGPVADDDSVGCDPWGERVGVEGFVGSLADEARGGSSERRGIDLAHAGIEDRPDEGARRSVGDPGERFERRDRGNRKVAGVGDALREREADAEAGEGAGADRDGEAVDARPVETRVGERALDERRETARMRARARVGDLGDDLVVACDADRGGPGGGVDPEDDQGAQPCTSRWMSL
jgi:hypothetical protein